MENIAAVNTYSKGFIRNKRLTPPAVRLKTSTIANTHVNTAVDFTLNHPSGKQINLYSRLKEESIILLYFKSGWCPYCNSMLRNFQNYLSNFQSLGADIIGVSLDPYENPLHISKMNNLDYDVVIDPNNEIAKKYGVDLYHDFKMEIKPEDAIFQAVFTINRSSEITYKHINLNTKKVPSPEAVLNSMQLVY